MSSVAQQRATTANRVGAAGSRPGQRSAFWIVVTVVAFVSVFILPFLFPLKVPVFSPVYTAGGNNRVGAMLAAAVSMVTALLCWRFGFYPQPAAMPQAQRRPEDLRWILGAGLVVALATAVLGVPMATKGVFYGDAGYFLTQLRSGLVLHGRLYRDFEFAYGPLLYAWPALFVRVLAPLHVSAAMAYVVSLCAMELVGTAMLFYTARALPMRRGMQLTAFLVLCVVTLDPQLGLNYTAFRFICSITSLVVLSRQVRPGRAAATAALCAVVNFAVSPEMGVAFVAGACALCAYRASTAGVRWLLPAAAALAGAGLFSALVGPDYFRTLKEFASGGYSMLLEPAPHIYFLLLCAIGLAPTVAATVLADRASRDRAPVNGLLLGTFVAGLALLPAALGRCDPLHVSFNGLPLFLLSFVALDRCRLPVRRVGVVLALLFTVYCVAQEYALNLGGLKTLAGREVDWPNDADLPRLSRVLGKNQVSFPWNTTLRLADQLAARGQYHPLYLCIGPVDDAAERRLVAEVRQADYALSPNRLGLVNENKINNSGMRFRLRFGYRYREKREPHLQGALMLQELQANWRRVDTFGEYDLYRKVR